ncbi:uncharacterized protein LOC118415298 [Branchiostoma floridae]|uniref:Uncharacterized protein LOC118415298 n=1 Tax=Branchiostoma floridae TaxID=7739 RepID=A0A9J7L570_BRAFL|nr:uncharacterized protein LOC118415298 [Branchiostoma floridae]
MSICSHFSTMEDIKTATTALKAVVELGYPLELSRVLNYLENVDSKDQLIQFDNEEALCSFLKKFPSMFWVDGSNVFPAQMKPKGGLRCLNKTWLPQSQPIVQPGSNGSDERRQQDHPIGVVEEQVFAIDSNDLIHIQPSPTIEGSDDDDILSPSVSQSSSMEEDIDSADASNGSIELNGSLASQSSSSDEDATNGRTDNAAIPEPHISSSEEDSDVECTQDVEALLEEGAAHIVNALEKKGSMPLGRIHGHVNQCREEVRKAVGGGPEKARALFLKFPAYFFIDGQDDVHLTSKLIQECINAVSATLERKGPLQVVELVRYMCHLDPKVSSFFESNDPKTFLEQHSKIFVINDSMVYLVSDIKEEGVQHFKRVLESKGSLHIKHICGHSSQYKYLGPMLKVIGGSPSSVLDFLKSFPEVFGTDDEGMVCLISATTAQSQGNKHVTENRTYAMVVEKGQKIQTNAPFRSPQENILGMGKSASSTAVVPSQNKENIQLEGVRHFKQVLESKGSMPVQNIWGHVNQCRDRVKWAIGCTADKVKKFLLGYPEVFHIDKKMIVHLVCSRANKQQQHQHKINLNPLQSEQKALAHFKEMLSRKGPSSTHVLSSCFSSCGEDIRMHVGNSKEGLTKFFMKHPQIFKVDANQVVYLKGTSLSKSGNVSRPQRWASCDTLAISTKTMFPKPKLLSKLGGSTPDVRSTICEGRLHEAKEVQEKPSHLQQPQEDCKDNHGTSDDDTSTCRSLPYIHEQHTSDQKADSSKHISDKFITAVKDILSKKGCLHLVQLVEELSSMFPDERFELSGVRLFLKKCPAEFHVNDQDMVEELPPMNVPAMVKKMLSNNSCYAILEDGSRVFVYITLYRERMGVDCIRLQDHLSPGDILLVDTEHGEPETSMKWTATNITAVFKSSKCVDADKDEVNLQTPMPFLPAATIERSPPEICHVLMKFVASFLRITSPLQVKDLSSRIKYLNHDAILYLREKGGLLSFLQSQPQMFHVQDGCVTSLAGQTELIGGSSQCMASPGAKCTIGKVSVIDKNIAQLCLPDDKKAVLDLTDATKATSCLEVGDCVVAYVVPAPDQSQIPWVVSKVKHGMGKAAPAEVQARAATATCGSHLLKEVLQQCVLEEEVDTVLAWHRLLSWKLKMSFESFVGCFNDLPKEAQKYTSQTGGPCKVLEQYPTLFHVDNARGTVCLVECSSKGRMVFRSDQIAKKETEQDVVTISANGEQLSPAQPTVEGEVKMAGYPAEKTSTDLDICNAESNQKNHNVPTIEAGHDTGTSLLKPSHSTEEGEDTDLRTAALVTNHTRNVSPVPPVQTPGLGEQCMNQEQAVCDGSGLPTATVHPMTVPSVNSNVANAGSSSDGVYTETSSVVDHITTHIAEVVDMHSTQATVTATQHVDLTSSSRGFQTEDVRTDTQDSHTSPAENTDALPPSPVDIFSDSSQSLQGTEGMTWAWSKPDMEQGWPPHLVTESGANVWENAGQQDMQPLAAVCPAEFVVPGTNPPGQPDDFTSLLPMFKDNLSPIQDNLVEVEMDIGRIPVARFYNPQTPSLLAATRLSDQTLTRDTLETILFGLPLERSAIGQGRVLLRGTLHWVSTLKNSLGEVVGLTLRRGQAVPGCLDLLWDVVTSGTSTLIMGRPCSGKTTLLREWARVLSDVCYRRVIVVDTRNEIAGGDDIPHPGIGGARRVQVHNRCDQVFQLQTAARNHSPDCIIVDEVQTQEEVTALQAIRLTGIQVVAGVCAGCLPDLLHNSVMRGLLGLSGPAASTSSPLGGTFPETLPVFQAAVVIHSRDMVSVYSDVASFVRVSLLEGRFPLAQQRKRVVTKDRDTELL